MFKEAKKAIVFFSLIILAILISDCGPRRDRGFVKHRFKERRDGWHRTLARRRAGFYRQLVSELNLTPSQKEEIKRILDKHTQEMEEEYRRMIKQIRRIREQTDSDIISILNKEQAEKYIRLKRLGRRGPDRPPVDRHRLPGARRRRKR